MPAELALVSHAAFGAAIVGPRHPPSLPERYSEGNPCAASAQETFQYFQYFRHPYGNAGE